jgi:hypothetical protein|tara:strand:+ start:460 stop:750 length:291 start_codon:yes stop_codon:yes gene_type:complete
MEKLDIEKFDEWDNPELKEVVEDDNELKAWLVDYVGNKHEPDDGNVTVEMIVETLAEEFPEFTMAVAGENFLRGYHQALCDLEVETSESQHNKTQS